jgi:prolyl-tRNA synthetase
MKTGRWDSTGDELMTVKDRHKRDYVLSPVSKSIYIFIYGLFFVVFIFTQTFLFQLQTHEEAITDLVATLPMLTYRQLPLKLYQMNSKFRDEFRPRFGLLRGREFIMKDLYTFDKTVEKAQETYDSICQAYHNIFQRLGVPFVKGSTVTFTLFSFLIP